MPRCFPVTFLPARATPVTPSAIAIDTRLGLVHLDLPLIYLLAVQGTDSLLGSFLGRHLDEGKAFRPARVAIGDHPRRFDLTELAKQGSEGVLTGVIAS
jgi:hypothetical protein